MSDAPVPAESVSETSPPDASPPADRATPPKGRWRRRLKVSFWIAIIAVIASRIALPFALPSMLDAALESRGLKAEYDTLDLSILGADLELWHLEIRDRESGELYLHTEYCRADVAVTELLFGRLIIRRLESDGVDIHLRREADGTVPLFARLSIPRTPDDDDRRTNDRRTRDRGPATVETLEPPLELHAVRFQHAHIHLRDDAVDPPFSTRVRANLRLSNVGHPERPAVFEFDLAAPGIVDAVRIEGTADTSPERLTAKFRCDLNGFDPRAVRAYLPTLRREEQPHPWSAAGSLALDCVRDDDAGWRISAHLSDVHLTAGGLARTTLERAKIEATVEDGSIVLHAIEADTSVTFVTLATADGPGDVGSHVDRLRVTRVESADAAASKYDIRVDYSLPGLAGQSQASGHVTLSEAHVAGELTLAMAGVRPTAAEMLLAHSGIEIPTDDHTLRGRLTFDATFGDVIGANCQLSEVRWVDRNGSTSIGLDRLDISEIRVIPDPLEVRIDAIEIAAPYANVIRRADGSIVAAGFRFGSPATTPTEGKPVRETNVARPPVTAPVTAPTSAASPPPRVTIRSVRLHGSRLDFEDWALEDGASATATPHVVHLDDFELEMTDLAYPPDDSGTVAGTIRFGVRDVVPATTIQGTLTRTGSLLEVRGSFRSEKISTLGITAYLRAAGVDLEFDDVTVSAKVEGTWHLDDRRARFELTEGTIRRGETTLATVVRAHSDFDGRGHTLGVDVAGSLPGVIDDLRLAASADWTRWPDGAATATCTVATTGIRGESFEALLPDEVQCVLEAGACRLQSQVTVESLADDGYRIAIELDDIRIDDAETSLFAVDRATLAIDRLAPDVCWLDTVTVAGATLTVDRAHDGSIELLGLRISPPPEPSVPSGVDSSEAATVTYSPSVPSSGASSSTARPAPPLPERRVPSLRLRRLSVELAALEYRDELLAEPITVTTRIENREPWRILEPDGVDLTPLAVQVVASVAPLIDTIEIDASATPFASRPEVQVQLRTHGWQGSALTSLLPALADAIDASALDGASLAAELWASFDLKRRSPLELDFRRSIGIEGRLSEFVLRSVDGEPLAGVRAIDIADVQFHLDRRELQIGRVEIDTPIARIARAEDHIEFAGLRVLLPEAQEGEALDNERENTELSDDDRSSPAQPDTDTAPTPSRELPAESFVVALGELRIQGADVIVTDRTLTPSWTLPVNDLDLEIRNFAFGAPNTIPTELTLRMQGAAFERDPREGETPRSIFGEWSVDARVMLGSVPSGRIRSSLSGLELVAFRTPAEALGVTLHGGVVDLEIDLKLRDDGAVESSGQVVMTDLDIEEGPDGPIRRLLDLPTPLQVAVFVVRDDDGSITIPANLELPGQGEAVPLSAIALAASKVVGSVITDAIAASPFRITGTVVDLVGLGDDGPPTLGEPVPISFDGGGTIPRWDATLLAQVRDELLGDETVNVQLVHFMGRGDLEVARRRANPPAEECAALAERLRRRRRDLIAEREALIIAATDAVVSGLTRRAKHARAQLRHHEAEIGTVGRAIDRWVTLAAGTSPHRAARRTRAAALQIASRRLALLARQLVEAGIPEERLRIRRPKWDAPIDRGEVRLERYRK